MTQTEIAKKLADSYVNAMMTADVPENLKITTYIESVFFFMEATIKVYKYENKAKNGYIKAMFKDLHINLNLMEKRLLEPNKEH